MKDIIADEKNIAFCGLYCGACKKFLNDKCPGCQENQKASWCKVRTCCMEKNYQSCADCEEKTLDECKYFSNFMASIFGFIFNSDRHKCIDFIKNNGYESFAQHMSAEKIVAMKRK